MKTTKPLFFGNIHLNNSRIKEKILTESTNYLEMDDNEMQLTIYEMQLK